MTQEAMKLALDALKNHSGNYKLNMAEVFRQEVAITALEEALSEHAMQEMQRLGQEIEQEPLAWMWNNHGSIALSRFQKVGWQPLYTTPPQRPWVDLTDDEISASSKGNMTRNGFARAVLTKFKERNQ